MALTHADMSLRTGESLPLNIEVLCIRVGEFVRAFMRHFEVRLVLERARRPLPQSASFFVGLISLYTAGLIRRLDQTRASI